MASGKKPGPEGIHKGKPHINDGTLCRQESPRPGPIGITSPHAQNWMSNWKSEVSEWSSTAGDWFNRTGETVSGYGKSVLLSLVDWLPFKQASPFSTALLKHYVERSGNTYTLVNIPREWQDWIIKATNGRIGMHRELNPYNSGMFDLRNSLGHFNIEVKAVTSDIIPSQNQGYNSRQNQQFKTSQFIYFS